MGGLPIHVRAAHLLRLLAVLLLAAMTLAPKAAPAAASTGNPQILASCVARAMPGDRPEVLFAARDRFACGAKQAALGPGSFWVRFAHLPAPPEDGSPQLLSYLPGMQANADMFVLEASGAIHHQTLANTQLSRFTQIGGRVVIPFASTDRPAAAVLLRLDKAVNITGLLYEPRVTDTEASHRVDLSEMALYASFAGLGIALLAYNLVLWLTMRERYRLIYCLSVLAMLTYVFSHSGALNLFLPQVGTASRFRLNYVALSFLAVFSLRFIVDFLHEDRAPRWLDRIISTTGAAMLIAGVMVALVPFEWMHLADRIYLATFMPVPVLMILLTVYGWRHDRHAMRVLALAWSPPAVMALVRIAHSANLIPFSMLVEHSVVIAMGSEALLSSLAMSLRIKQIADERDLARAEENAARRLAEADPLTGLQNRRGLLRNALEWQSAEPLRLMLVDIDNFKRVNDIHGHDIGDDVLREVAAVLAARLEIRGTLARMGGEEFALLGAVREIPEGLALALLNDVRNARMPEGLQITISIGIADGMVNDEASWRDLYRRADTALYEAKRQGRNRAAHAPAPEQPALPQAAVA